MNAAAPAIGLEPESERLRVEFKTELADLPPLAERWERLNRRMSDHDAPFFQSYAWSRYVADVRARCSPENYKLLVATVWRGDELIGLWPLSLRRNAGVWMVRSLDDPFGQLAGVSFHDKADIGPGVAAILEALRGKADGLQIEGVVAGSALHAALTQHDATTTSSQQAVVVDVTPYPTFKAFEQTIKGSTRKVLRKRSERLREAHKVEEVVADDRTRAGPLLNEVFETRLQWLQQNGRTSSAFREDAFKMLISGLVHAEGIEPMVLALGTQVASIAAQLGFTYAGRFYAYMSSKNPAFDEFSPGRQLYKLVIESCFGRGIKIFEFMSPASTDKLEWNGQVKQIDTMVMPFNVKGRLALHLTHWLMPTAKRLSRTLPESVRKPLIRSLNRA